MLVLGTFWVDSIFSTKTLQNGSPRGTWWHNSLSKPLSANGDHFISSFPICILLSLSSSLHGLGLPVLMLNKSDGSRHPCLALGFGKKAFYSSLLGMILIVSFLYMSLTRLRKFFSIPNLLRAFYYGLMLKFANDFFLLQLIGSCHFSSFIY